VPSLLREPDDPYDDQPEEATPAAKPRRIEPCRVCWGTGRVHVIERGKDAGRERRCPVCRGRGFRVVDPP
jgi:hypothetical protein